MSVRDLFINKFIGNLKKYKEKDLTAFFISSIVFISILFVYSLIISLSLRRGVNADFTSFLWKILQYILALFVSVFLCYLLFVRKMVFSYKKKIESFQLKDFVLMLIPMTPVMQYILSNQGSLTILSSFLVFIFFAVIIAVFGVVVPVLLSKFAPKQILITAAISFLTLITAMASLSEANAWTEKGQISVQMIVLIVIILIIFARRFIPENLFIMAVLVLFTVNTVTGLLIKDTPDKGSTGTIENGNLDNIKKFSIVSALEGKTIKRHNDVLLIVFEAYADFETIKHYGFDNREQMALLEENGFHVYHGTYSLGAPTTPSLSKVFNVDRDISEHKQSLAGGSAVHDLLSKQGYKTYGVFDNAWNLRGLPVEEIKYDNTFPSTSEAMDTWVLAKAILTGEFSDMVSFEGVDLNSYLDYKRKVIKREYASPVFMYSHSNVPSHRPSRIFKMNQGKGDVNVKIYIEKLHLANEEMNKDIEIIIKDNPEAIVVIAGDHGPFLTKTGYGLHQGRGNFTAEDIDRYDVQDRFGSFLAIRWPEKKYAAKHDIKIFQDIFPAIFSYLYDDETLFDKTRLERKTNGDSLTLGVHVKDGIIVGGKDNGQKLFIMEP